MRMITSCLECRRRKLKCNKSQPCVNCQKFQRECLYLGPKLDEASQLRLNEIKDKVGSLERQLERDVAKGTAGGARGCGSNGNGDGSSSSSQQRILADDVEDDCNEEQDLQLTPMVALDLTYEDCADGVGTDDLIDLGIRVGRMRITERIGGLNRPRISEEIQAGIQNPFSGVDDMSDSSCESFPEFLRPGDSYLPPTSGFFFGQAAESPSLLHLLPGPNIGHRLVHRYFEAVHPIARCVHRPSFETTYGLFWEHVNLNYEPPASVQAVVFAAWFSAAVSLDEVQAQQEYGLPKSQMVDHMKVATETALSKANFLRTTRFETMQAFVMYMIPLCRDEVSRAHSVLVGAAVRMAECMGLHRDGGAYGLSPLETHVRRLIWHQLCFLDIRTCEAQGPKPAIRREDYDTKLPFNCEDTELSPHVTATPAHSEQWTSTMFMVMRFELNEMMRIIWADRRKLEMHKTTLTAVLTKIENFRRRMLERYNRYLDDRVPIQKYAKHVMLLLIHRLYAMVLHPYHSNAANPLPERLNGLLVASGVLIIETAILLESNPMFRDWAWYLGAYQQYQIALLLATEVYYRPQNKDAPRIWRCLDYVFNLDPNAARDAKSQQILTEIMKKASIYMGMRKVRAPTGIAKAVPDKLAVKDSPSPQSQGQGQGPSPMQQPQQLHLQHQHQQHPWPTMKTEPGMNAPHMAMPRPMSLMSTTITSSSSTSSASSSRIPHNIPVHLISPHQQPAVMPNMVFAGVSNGEVLWSLPPHGNPGSPENGSDGGSVVSQPQRHGSISGSAGVCGGGGVGVNLMDNLDWDALNILFPADPQTGELSFNSFIDPGNSAPGTGSAGAGGGTGTGGTVASAAGGGEGVRGGTGASVGAIPTHLKWSNT
ncbi:fungal-specific transcription factor domain-containing protein [Cladorrhinum samala]|uniref:Fungal-specific transcription factor domain-containing protein n=1 Tax=Cladorrhinum samala TaxID=585594 RepID=A0AAV9HZY6_9PEZI|nr:fungal-specific transcription factor domain-containing protein [Cladorrhinum samala]